MECAVSVEPRSYPFQFATKDQINRLLIDAASVGASDVIFKSNDYVWIRRHGVWIPWTSKVIQKGESVEILRILGQSNEIATQVLSGFDRDFAYVVPVDRFRSIRYRCNATACQTMGESGVCTTLRVTPATPPKLDDLDVPQEIREAIFPRYGLVIVTGPVGSGKTTLLAAALRHIVETEPRHVITYEAPIEFDLESLPERKGPVEQTEMGIHLVHRTDRARDAFDLAPRNSLRRAGDVVLVGEARDPDTIRAMSIEAETGVAVYTTAHTNSVSDTVTRLVREFPERERDGITASLLASLRLIVHQRLVPTKDGKRTAIREWLVFDKEVIGRVANLETNELTEALRNIVRERESSLWHDLVRKADVIDPEVFAAHEKDFFAMA